MGHGKQSMNCNMSNNQNTLLCVFPFLKKGTKRQNREIAKRSNGCQGFGGERVE